MNRCEKCNQWVYRGNTTLLGHAHKCPPEWLVIDTNNSKQDDWGHARLFYGYDFDDAATEAASYFDNQGDGPSERLIQVKNQQTNEVRSFNISFDYSVDYHANEVAA